MLEKDIENLIAQHFNDFFPNLGFKLVGQQVNLGGNFADIIFKDKHGRMVIVEIKRGILSRDASGQVIEYYGWLKQKNPDKFIELILCANIIPNERKLFLENVGIECKELGLSLISNIAKKYHYKFLDEEKNVIRSRHSKKQLVSEAKISKKKYNRCWIFQANPNRYDILNALLDSKLKKQVWLVNQHKDEIKEGDIALIWMSGREAGIYAITKIISNPAFIKDPPEEAKYWTSKEDKEKTRLRVKIKIIKNLVNNPILREEIKSTNGLTNMTILRFSQGTNFPVTDDEWEIIRKKVEHLS